jgi:integrase
MDNDRRQKGRAAPDGRDLLEGVYYRGRVVWIRYSVNGREEREPTEARTPREASRLRGERIAEHAHGERTSYTRTLRVTDLLDAVVTDYELNGYSSLPSARGYSDAIRERIGRLLAVEVTTDVVEREQRRWQRDGFTNATINRRCNILRRGFRLMVRAKKLHFVPYIPRLKEHSPRGRYIPPGDLARIREHLPEYLHDFLAFAYDDGIRKGQLARTLRRHVDLERGVIAWPAEECKHDEPHVLPLEAGGTLDIVQRLMAGPPLWCPYLFHGPRCAPGREPSKLYGCIGDFKKAWATAQEKAGFPVGRKHGGYVFHHTRNSATTNLVASGMSETDAMKVTGHKTAHVFRRYDIGDVDALRNKLARRREYVACRPSQSKVVSLGDRRSA